MPMKGASPTSSSAQKPKPWESKRSSIELASWSLRSLDRGPPRNRMTRGSALMTANASRSSGVQQRISSRSV